MGMTAELLSLPASQPLSTSATTVTVYCVFTLLLQLNILSSCVNKADRILELLTCQQHPCICLVLVCILSGSYCLHAISRHQYDDPQGKVYSLPKFQFTPSSSFGQPHSWRHLPKLQQLLSSLHWLEFRYIQEQHQRFIIKLIVVYHNACSFGIPLMALWTYT